MPPTCPVPVFGVTALNSLSDWTALVRSYSPGTVCGYWLASFSQQGDSEDARYGPFPTLSDFHAYWWTMAALKAFSLLLLSLFLVAQRYEWNRGDRFCFIGLMTLLTGLTIVVQVPTWSWRAYNVMFAYQNAELLIDWTLGWTVLCWGLVQVVESYYSQKHKLRTIAASLILWIWLRQAFLFSWTNQTNHAAVAAAVLMAVLTLLALATGLLLLVVEELLYPAATALISGVLFLTLQHDGDHMPYIQVTDDMGPFQTNLFMALVLILLLVGACLIAFVLACYFIVGDWCSSRRNETSSLPLVIRGAYRPVATVAPPAAPAYKRSGQAGRK